MYIFSYSIGLKNIIFYIIAVHGEDLKKLFSAPAIQHLISCKPMREIHSSKNIYQPGTLRKV